MEVLLVLIHPALLHSKVYETHDFELSYQKCGGKQSSVNFFPSYETGLESKANLGPGESVYHSGQS